MIATRSIPSRRWAWRAAIATLLKRQNPMGVSAVAWWPGGRTSASPFGSFPPSTASVTASTLPTASSAGSQESGPTLAPSPTSANSPLAQAASSRSMSAGVCTSSSSERLGHAGVEPGERVDRAAALEQRHRRRDPRRALVVGHVEPPDRALVHEHRAVVVGEAAGVVGEGGHRAGSSHDTGMWPPRRELPGRWRSAGALGAGGPERRCRPAREALAEPLHRAGIGLEEPPPK